MGTPVDGDCAFHEQLVVLNLDGRLIFRPSVKEVEASDLIKDNPSPEERKDLQSALSSKWLQRGRRVVKVTMGNFCFRGSGVKKFEVVRQLDS